MHALLDWRSSNYRVPEQYEAWASALNDSHLPWSLDRVPAAGFAARLVGKDLGSFRVVSARCEPCSGRRSARTARTGDQEYLAALLVLSGQERVRQNGQESVLGARSMLIWDSAKAIDFVIDSPLSKITLFIPAHEASRLRPLLDRPGRVVSCRSGIPAVLASHLQSLAGELDAIDGASGAAAADLTVDLIAAAIAGQEAEAGAGPQADLLEGIRCYIHDNLEDPALNPDGIANHFSISRRYLYLLYSSSGRAVCQDILEQRLERARRLLVTPSRPHRSITEVAGSVGLSDPAHFSRLFKARYGLSPRDYRRAHATLS